MDMIVFDTRISMLIIFLLGWLPPGKKVVVFADQQLFARLGSSIEIKCPNRSLTSHAAWFRGKGTSQISEGQFVNDHVDRSRFSITGNFSLGEYNLEIRHIERKDLGIYVCSKVLSDITFEFSLNLISIKLPSDLHIYSLIGNTSHVNNNYIGQDTKVIGIENDTLMLHCNLSSGVPKEKMMWSFRNQRLKDGGYESIELILKLKPSDTGIYACSVNSSVLETPLVRTVDVTVLYRPRVSIKKEGRYNVIEGNAMILYCNIDSDPKEVNISWFKKESQGDIEMGTGTKLQLNVVTRRDSGLYVCIAENAIGKGLSGTSITVMYAPEVTIQFPTTIKDYGVRKLKCNPSGVPKMYTFYDWEHISDYGDHIRFMTGSKDGILQFPPKKYPYQDNGFYTCTASNGIPNTNGITRQSGSVYMDVKGIPVFTAKNTHNFYGKLNASIDITVHVFSHPKYSELLIHNQNGIRISDDVTNVKILEEYTFINDIIYKSNVKVKGYKITMKIAHLKQDQFQKYTFTVKNEFGLGQYTISVSSESGLQPKSVGDTTVLVSIVSVIILVILIVSVLSCWLKRKNRIDINASREIIEDSSHYDEIVLHDTNEVISDVPVHSSSSNVINIQFVGSTSSEISTSGNHSSESPEDGSSSSETGTNTTDPKDLYNRTYQALVDSTSQQIQVSTSYETLEMETRLEDRII